MYLPTISIFLTSESVISLYCVYEISNAQFVSQYIMAVRISRMYTRSLQMNSQHYILFVVSFCFVFVIHFFTSLSLSLYHSRDRCQLEMTIPNDILKQQLIAHTTDTHADRSKYRQQWKRVNRKKRLEWNNHLHLTFSVWGRKPAGVRACIRRNRYISCQFAREYLRAQYVWLNDSWARRNNNAYQNDLNAAIPIWDVCVLLWQNEI